VVNSGLSFRCGNVVLFHGDSKLLHLLHGSHRIQRCANTGLDATHHYQCNYQRMQLRWNATAHATHALICCQKARHASRVRLHDNISRVD